MFKCAGYAVWLDQPPNFGKPGPEIKEVLSLQFSRFALRNSMFWGQWRTSCCLWRGSHCCHRGVQLLFPSRYLHWKSDYARVRETGWQKLAGFRWTQKMPSNLSSSVYLLICGKKLCFWTYYQIFCHICKHLSRSIKSFTKRLNRNKCLHCDKIAYVSAYKFLPSPNFSPWPEGKFCECLHRHSTLPSMDYKQNRWWR